MVGRLKKINNVIVAGISPQDKKERHNNFDHVTILYQMQHNIYCMHSVISPPNQAILFNSFYLFYFQEKFIHQCPLLFRYPTYTPDYGFYQQVSGFVLFTLTHPMLCIHVFTYISIILILTQNVLFNYQSMYQMAIHYFCIESNNSLTL